MQCPEALHLSTIDSLVHRREEPKRVRTAARGLRVDASLSRMQMMTIGDNAFSGSACSLCT